MLDLFEAGFRADNEDHCWDSLVKVEDWRWA
jgi:hypothetical protein